MKKLNLPVKVVHEPDRDSLVYMDYNATTPLAEEVILGISASLRNDWGNASSGNPFGSKAKSEIRAARNEIAKMVNCSPEDVIFTSGGTESNNMAIFSAYQYFQEFMNSSPDLFEPDSKPHFITSNIEHDSVLFPLAQLEKKDMIKLSLVKANQKGFIEPRNVMSEITGNTCFVSIMYANNETGVMNPIGEIGRLIHSVNNRRDKQKLFKVLFHTDAAQVIGKEPVDFQSLNVHYMTIAGHKFYGPKVGCLCISGPFFPMMHGGGQERGLRPGTENTPMIVGLGIAAKLVSQNLSVYRQHMLMCRNSMETLLSKVFGDDILINFNNSHRLSNTISLAFKSTGLEGNLVLSRCNTLIASVGAACHENKPSQVLINSGLSVPLSKNTIRISLGRDTTIDDVEKVVTELHYAVNKLRAVKPDSKASKASL